MLILINKSILDMALDLVVMHCTKNKFSLRVLSFFVQCGTFSVGNAFGENVIIFWVDTSSSVYDYKWS